jgi:TolB-like protein
VRTITLLIVLSSLTVSAAAEETSIAVMEFASKGGVSQEQMDALSDMLANEIRNRGEYRVIGKSDIRTALNLEEQKTMLGCNDNSCIAEIGGALGVRWVVVGNVSLFGETFLLNLKLMDVEAVKVAWGTSKKVTGGQAKLIDALADVAEEMMASFGKPPKEVTPKEVTPKEGKVSSTSDPTPPIIPPKQEKPVVLEIQAEETHPFSTWGHVTFWSGLGMMVIGGIATGVAIHEGNNYSEDGQSMDARLDSADRSRTWAGVMWTSFGLGIISMTTGIVLWSLEPDQPATTTSLGVTPDGQGAVLTVGGRW